MPKQEPLAGIRPCIRLTEEKRADYTNLAAVLMKPHIGLHKAAAFLQRLAGAHDAAAMHPHATPWLAARRPCRSMAEVQAQSGQGSPLPQLPLKVEVRFR